MPVDLNGDADYIYVDDTTEYGHGDWTCAFVLRPDAVDGFDRMVYLDDEFLIAFASSGQTWAQVLDSGDADDKQFSDQTSLWTAGGRPVHFCVNYESSTSNFEFYINGDVTSDSAGGSPFTIAGQTDDRIFIGSRGPNNFINGQFHDFALWNRKLSAKEIAILGKSRKKRCPLRFPENLQVYLPLDDYPIGTPIANTTFYDLSGNGKHGIGVDADGDSSVSTETFYSYGSVVIPVVGISTSSATIATPSLVSVTILANTATALVTNNAIATPTLISVSVLTGTVNTIRSVTASPSTAIVSVTVGTPNLLITKSSLVTVSTALVSVLVNTATAITAVITTATPSLVSVSVVVNTATAINNLGATATPSLVSVSVFVGTVTVLISNSATAQPSVELMSVVVNTPTVQISNNSLVAVTALSVSVAVNSPKILVQNSATASPSLSLITLAINDPTVLTPGSQSNIDVYLLLKSAMYKTILTSSQAYKIINVKSGVN